MLIDQIERRLKRHVVISDEAALAAALWTYSPGRMMQLFTRHCFS